VRPDWSQARRFRNRLAGILAALGVIMFGPMLSAATRHPAVAGSFYPADPTELERGVRAALGPPAEQAQPVRALIVPHAGYVFSGATAGRAFATLAGAAIDRVVLLGPSHHASFSGAALPDPGVTGFATPLGVLPLDREAIEQLRPLPDFQGPARAHGPEHCLEVELPFLQAVAGAPKLVPLLIGHGSDRGTARRIARQLAPWLGDGTVVVVSSDFTHHGAAYGYAPFGRTGGLDARLGDLARLTAGRAAAVDPQGFWHQVETSGDTVCGARPILVLLELLAHAFAGDGRVADVTTSAAVSRDLDQVVSYASVVHSGHWTAWREDPAPPVLGELDEVERRAVVGLARATLETHLGHGGQLAAWFAAHRAVGNLAAHSGAFVTLNTRPAHGGGKGHLRGCIGTLEAREPLGDAIVRAAVSAAHDPRFPALEARELPGVTVEVSVLSPLVAVEGWQGIELGRHGVLLTKHGRQAVFLPQVGREYGWDLATFLSQLAQKAGLEPDAWRHGTKFEVFTAQVFAEEE